MGLRAGTVIRTFPRKTLEKTGTEGEADSASCCAK
jgi:hypothetical protein